MEGALRALYVVRSQLNVKRYADGAVPGSESWFPA